MSDQTRIPEFIEELPPESPFDFCVLSNVVSGTMKLGSDDTAPALGKLTLFRPSFYLGDCGEDLDWNEPSFDDEQRCS